MPIAIFAGTDRATARRRALAYATEHDPGGQSTSRLDGQIASTGEIAGQIGVPGFFGGGRVVIVTDFLSRTKRGGKRGADDEGEGSASQADLAAIFAALHPDNHLVLLDGGLASLPAAVSKALPPGSLVELAEPPRGPRLVEWIRERAAAGGTTISTATARRLAARLYPKTWASAPANPRYDRPPDMERLGGEIELVCAAHPGAITDDLVDLMVEAGDADEMFQFGDAAGQGNLRAALPELRRLLDAGDEPAKLLNQLGQQAELLAVVDAASGRDLGGVARDLAMPSAGRLNALAATRRKGARTGRQAIAAAIAADRSMKRGLLRQPDAPLYRALTRIASAEE